MHKPTKILITGGTGLIGKHLKYSLLEKGYQVHVLSRSAGSDGENSNFFWDIDQGIIQPEALHDIDFIFHLAGINIGDKRWSSSRKKSIMDSRIKPGLLLLNHIKENQHHLKAFISSSAVGYYGSVTSDKIFSEDDQASDDFLGSVCKQWEDTADKFSSLGSRVVKIRTGVVLSTKGGALKKLVPLFKYGLGSALGSGKQYMPWIHIDDLCNIYIKAIEDNNVKGAYNAVSPCYSTNKEFSKALAKVLKKPLWLPNVPGFILKLAFGKMAVLLLHGSKVSSKKIESSGYDFKYKELESALSSLVK